MNIEHGPYRAVLYSLEPVGLAQATAEPYCKQSLENAIEAGRANTYSKLHMSALNSYCSLHLTGAQSEEARAIAVRLRLLGIVSQ